MAAATALVFTFGFGAGLGFASPVQAEPVMNGVYTYTQEGLEPQTWSIFPSCVPVVGDLREPLELAVACRLHVEASRGDTNGGDARLADGQWQFITSKIEGMQCPDGSWAPITETYRFNDVTLTGTRSVAHNAVCGLAPSIHTVPFQLAYQRPLPHPVDRYPLDCEPWGLRLCT